MQAEEDEVQQYLSLFDDQHKIDPNDIKNRVKKGDVDMLKKGTYFRQN